MAVRGDRFKIDLDLDNDESQIGFENNVGTGLLVKDIMEKDAVKAPTPPSLKDSSTGFPSYRRRGENTRFRQHNGIRAAGKQPSTKHVGLANPTPQGEEKEPSMGRNYDSLSEGRSDLKREIDEENKNRIAHMSEEEIEAAKAEIASALSPSLIERLLKKANIDDQNSTNSIEGHGRDQQPDLKLDGSTKKVKFQYSGALHSDNETQQPASHQEHPPFLFDPDAPPSEPPADLQSVSDYKPTTLSPGAHFPVPQRPTPDLDPSSPNFLDSLRETYFPHLPADPSTQSWMADPLPAEAEAYSATDESLPASSIRLDFRGRLLPPRLSAQIPTSKGLHHHGHAPESAGYTIPELAHLARSAVPAQRSAAYQTLGRILYRLGRGDFGGEGEDLHDGLWDCMDRGRVVEGMVAAAGQEGGNRSVWATATEALWLWRKGGGRKRTGR